MSTEGTLELTTSVKTTSTDNPFKGHNNNPETIGIFKSFVENPDDLTNDATTGEEGASVKKKTYSLKSVQTTWSVPFYEYVIVTTRALAPAFNEFLNWKKRKGYNTGIVCIEDILNDAAATGDNMSSPALTDNAGKLRQYLKAGYDNTSPKTSYALLGGDTIVPIRYGKGDNDSLWINGEGKIPSDLYFSDFNSNWTSVSDTMTGTYYSGFDYGPEIYVGRLLCNSQADINTWTTKVLKYEQNPGNGSYSYLSKALFTEADKLGIIDTLVLPSVFTHTVVWKESPSDTASVPTSPTGAQVISELNSNYGLYCVFNHGSPLSFAVATAGENADGKLPRYQITYNDSYVSTNITPETGNGLDNLTNYNYPTILYSISCQTMPYDDYYYWGTNRKIPSGSRTLGASYTVAYSGGGPAYLGNTRDGYVPHSRYLETNFFDSINLSLHLGIAEEKSKIGLPYHSGLYHWVCLAHNLLGCPETELWTATPTTYSPTINVNGDSVTINSGVSGSKICVMSALDNGSSYFDVEPNVTSHTFSSLPDYYYVTVTKHNKIPYLRNPTTVLIEHTTMSTNCYLNCQTVSAGYNVNTSDSDSGNVVIQNGANVTFDATGDILLDRGFEVQLGATFEAK